MGKQPAAGQKKTKEAIAKAAQAKKGGKKKWTKGKAKDKVNHAVFIEKKNVESIINNPSKVGKVLTVSTVVEKLKVNGSLARQLMRTMADRKLVEKVAKNGNQWVYSVIGGVKEDKTAAPAAAGGKKQQQSKKGAAADKEEVQA
ncbi:S25 ribosomal protein (macronuclear) [Tetrahymena thermophila SB210]|uniref:40S ribosomal protein S25 n=2 Tax=Tetrahymena thermophila TaxID=5911 RepID=I7M463_TETTS|nr:S25 ribosomal protein [Tetrahymena thermophila SB210]2XZN_8 Chain 8, Rps25e [Tetrahymena thermophila]4BPN_8 Chain 8, 40s Ribosomal Protein Rps25e [Tetrahymena thermophila]4BPO_8 Chain 8, 40s Ribosomal Protein Rps25e [Tetrahymena thermophila]4BTS_A8 Chain A8, 40S RIBOSOMAL PROTEIN RPS25E [Tetrahymena thermophila]4BTS_B8 Chain B8, 40S RIBOSOMAL PROTEIN RPS25E [Tetrahymena thermophila]4BTS_C8 Chain C8, 40S RIBOSOMAL PROTEIN RPS25E [Tetrahymena thermophila]4BTS_D8 Chain D8, 40S RIBOSOMAL PROT|eukprot:XP_001025224.2 S25 ribosomal protein [Tetrahymena thermophila SB210]